MKKTKRKFPCPYCKGQGGAVEDLADAYGPGGPWYDCGICQGNAMVEIGGKIHRLIRKLSCK